MLFLRYKKLSLRNCWLFFSTILYDTYDRGEDGELRLGIRRAAQVKVGSTFSALCGQQLNHSNYADVVHAVSMRSAFSIYYNPRYGVI